MRRARLRRTCAICCLVEWASTNWRYRSRKSPGTRRRYIWPSKIAAVASITVTGASSHITLNGTLTMSGNLEVNGDVNSTYFASGTVNVGGDVTCTSGGSGL